MLDRLLLLLFVTALVARYSILAAGCHTVPGPLCSTSTWACTRICKCRALLRRLRSTFAALAGMQVQSCRLLGLVLAHPLAVKLCLSHLGKYSGMHDAVTGAEHQIGVVAARCRLERRSL
jgi:hypothetical protein